MHLLLLIITFLVVLIMYSAYADDNDGASSLSSFREDEFEMLNDEWKGMLHS